MKKNIIAILILFVIYACNEAYDPYESEVAISKDCTFGRMSFDADSIRCGWSENAYISVILKDDYRFSPYDQYDLYLFSDSSAKSSKDSIWFFEKNADKLPTCEKNKMVNVDVPGFFCLKNFDRTGERVLISNYADFDKNLYFVYNKHGAYNAFCNVVSDLCFLLYSCVVQYDGTYNFSKVPDAKKDVNQNTMVGCIIL